MMSMYLGKFAAGATWPPPWRKFQVDRPDIARDLRVIWRTGPLPGNGLLVRRLMPEGSSGQGFQPDATNQRDMGVACPL